MQHLSQRSFHDTLFPPCHMSHVTAHTPLQLLPHTTHHTMPYTKPTWTNAMQRRPQRATMPSNRLISAPREARVLPGNAESAGTGVEADGVEAGAAPVDAGVAVRLCDAPVGCTAARAKVAEAGAAVGLGEDAVGCAAKDASS